jgi:hypothetical protein
MNRMSSTYPSERGIELDAMHARIATPPPVYSQYPQYTHNQEYAEYAQYPHGQEYVAYAQYPHDLENAQYAEHLQYVAPVDTYRPLERPVSAQSSLGYTQAQPENVTTEPTAARVSGQMRKKGKITGYCTLAGGSIAVAVGLSMHAPGITGAGGFVMAAGLAIATAFTCTFKPPAPGAVVVQTPRATWERNMNYQFRS